MTFRPLRKLLWALLGVAAAAPLSVAAAPATEPVAVPGCGPAPASHRAWTLADLLAQALCRDPRTRQSWAQIQAQRARVEADRAAVWPRLDLRASAGRDTGSSTDLPGSSASLGLDLSWLLYDGGRRSAGTQALQQALAEAGANHDLALQAVVHDTVQAYLELRDEIEHLSLQLELKSRFDAIRQELRRRRAPESDQLEVRWSLSQADIERHEAVKALALAQGRLAVLLGLPPDQAPPIASEAADRGAAAPSVVSEPQLREWMAQAQRQHPEILAAQARAGAAQAQLVQAERSRRPSVELTATQGRTQYSRWEADRSREAGLQLSLPLFDGGASAAQTRAALAERDGALASMEEMRRRVAQGVWEAYQEVLRAAAVRQETQHAAAIARRLLQDEQLHAHDPDAEFTDLLDAQEREVRARLERERARSAWELAHWRLALAVGRLQPDAARAIGSSPGAADPVAPRTGAAPPPRPLAAAPLSPPAPVPPVQTLPAVAPAERKAAPPSGGCRAGEPGPGGGWCVPR